MAKVAGSSQTSGSQAETRSYPALKVNIQGLGVFLSKLGNYKHVSTEPKPTPFSAQQPPNNPHGVG